MKKKIGIFLVLLSLVFLLPGAFAADEQISVFSVETTGDWAYNGYLISVHPDITPRLSPLSVGVERIADNLYHADSIQVAEKNWREDQILYIEPNYNIVPLGIPNDFSFYRQWDMIMINAPALWQSEISADGVRVAVLDTGLFWGHEDLDYTRVTEGFNYITNTTDVRDNAGHGTAVTGIIAATRNNGIGMAGLVCEVIIIPLQVMDVDAGTLSMSIQAVYDAVNIHAADVINMSFGIQGNQASRALEDAVNFAASQGAILVAAVGNDGNQTIQYPAGYANVIGVGAVDQDGRVARFSQRNESVFVTAPGQGVLTLGHRAADEYRYVNGTSFAAPFVSAMAAAAKGVRPDITQAEFAEILTRSVTDAGTPGYDVYYGHGMIDLTRFVAAFPEVKQPYGFWDIDHHWARDSILRAVDLGLFTGVSATIFAPDMEMSRAMFVTVLGRLYRQMGGDIPQRNDTFIDTQRDFWYSPYVAWAAQNGIVTGVGGNRFAPDDPVRRQEAAVILYRFAGYVGLDITQSGADLERFIDAYQVADWAYPAMIWAVDRGLITGISTQDGMMLRPEWASTRAEVAVIMGRFIDRVGVTLLAA
ncbi:MAG: S8 family serine peptidase [Oscillospiraceae bacterium]|nr:S8 family serine peptidase [Oscillospiraceae bacterium]